MIHPSQIPFDHSILSDYSQYSFGGEQSCTYICLSAVEYFLNNYQKFRIPISSLNCQDKITLQDIDYVMQLGVSRDRRVGLTSCDDVYSTSDHFKKTLELKSIHISKLSDTLCFKQLLKEMESKSNDTKSSSDITAVVLTKPPETIAIFYDCYGYVNGKENEYYPWFIFDSHPRKYGKGGGFYLFKDLSKIEDYLKKLFIDDFDFYRKMFDSYQAKSHVMFEGTIVTLKSPIMPPKIINQPTIVQPTTIRPTTTTAQTTTIQPPTTNQQVPKNVITTNTPMANNTPPQVVVQNKHQQNPSHVVAQQTPPDNTQLISQLMKKIEVLEQTNRQQYEEIETLKYLLKEEQDCHKNTLHENQQLRKGTKQDHNVLDKIFSSF